MDTSHQSLRLKAFQQLKDGLIIALYLWLIFGLLTLHKSMILAEHHIDFTSHGFALINALALSKVMLVARHLRLGDRLQNEPLLYYSPEVCFIYNDPGLFQDSGRRRRRLVAP